MLRHFRKWAPPSAVPWLILAILTVFVIFQQLHNGLGRIPSDGPSYMRPALIYAQTGVYQDETWRERGYPAAIWLISRIFPWSDDIQLARWVNGIQSSAYLGLYLLLVAGFIYRRALWLAVGIATAFSIDAFNGTLVASILSEAPATLILLCAMVCLLAALGAPSRRWVLVPTILLVGLVPLFRSADLAMMLAAGFGVTVWWLMCRSRRTFLVAAGLGILLIGPTYIFCQILEWRTGYFGLSERGSNHVAARFMTIADPDKVLASGVPADLVESLFRPVYRDFNHLAGRHDLVRPGSDAVFYPLTRERSEFEKGALPLESRVKNYLAQTGQATDDYTVAALSSRLASMALRADPAPIVRSILEISCDYFRIPWTEPDFYGEAKKRIYVWWLIWGALIFALWRARPLEPVTVAMISAAAVALPGYWLSIAAGSSYNPRFTTHPFMLVTLTLALAVLYATRDRKTETAQ